MSTSVGNVKIESPVYDYYNYQAEDPPVNEEEFSHVIELSNFPSHFHTEDLMSMFSEFKAGGFDIKWVDDTHALAVFSSTAIGEYPKRQDGNVTFFNWNNLLMF